MSTVILLIVVLAILVLAHELGHFLVAKWSGIDVEEFGLGLPPRAWGKKFGDTLYSLNWIPFGGFVRISGDDDDAATPTSAPARLGRGFKEKSFLTKTSVMAGGVIANAYLAFFFIAIALWIGLPISLTNNPDVPVKDAWVAILAKVPDSPVGETAMQVPNKLVAISVGDGGRVSVEDPAQAQNLIQTSAGQEVTFYVIEKNNQEKAYSVNPIVADSGGESRLSVGIALDKLGIPDYGPFQSLGRAFNLSGEIIVGTVQGLVGLIAQTFSGQGSLDSVSGPVGIAGVLASAKSEGIASLLFIMALISLSLAVINFVPFPALDGGRFLFLLIEKIKGTPINTKLAQKVNLTGFALLLLLMLVVTYHDIIKL